MLKTFFTLVGIACAFLLSACSTPPPRNTIDIYLEAPSRSSAFGLHPKITMPVSKVETSITTPPVATIDAFTNSEVLVQEIPLGGNTSESIPGIRLQVNSKAWMKIYQAAEDARTSKGGMKRLFLLVNNKPIGYCPIRRQIRKNDLFFIIESPKTGRELAEELKEVNFILNEYILAYREFQQEQK